MQPNARNQEVRVGIITLLSITLLVAGIVWGKGIGVGSATRTLKMSFPNASGIDVGSPVTFNGVRKGVVTAINAKPDGVVLVASVDADVPLTDAIVPQIQMAELTGGKKIELVSRKGPSHPLKEGDVIPGELQGDVNALLATANDVSLDVRRLLKQLDTTMVAVNGIVTNERLVRSIETSALNLEEASNAARDLVVSNRGAIATTVNSLHQTTLELRGLLQRTSPVIERTIGASGAAIEDLRRVAVVADATIRNADTLIARLDTLTYDVKHGDGTVSRLLYDRKLADELATTVKEARLLVQQIRKFGVNINVSLGSKP
jgi:phospholipid/cholesterol/gamma-HCH transport system substrate-binding protein